MADSPESAVIDLQSHPLWLAAQPRARQRNEDMRRHPSFVARQHASAAGGEAPQSF